MFIKTFGWSKYAKKFKILYGIVSAQKVNATRIPSRLNLGKIGYMMPNIKPVSSFRSKYDYNNLIYLVAGEGIARISKIPYEGFIVKRIMEPPGMRLSGISCEMDHHADEPWPGMVQA
jgi:hypothetical protein